MAGIRTFVKRYPALAPWLIALALIVKAIVPQGYMVVSGKTFTVMLCSGMSPGEMMVTVPVNADHGEEHPQKKVQDRACPYSALGHAVAPAADPVLLLGAIAFVLALGLAPSVYTPLRRRIYFQPPLRGPPALT